MPGGLMQLIAYGAQDILYGGVPRNRVGVGHPAGAIVNKKYKDKKTKNRHPSVKRHERENKHLERIDRRRKRIKMEKEGCESPGYQFNYDDRYERSIYDEVIEDDIIEETGTKSKHYVSRDENMIEKTNRRHLSKLERKKLKKYIKIARDDNERVKAILPLFESYGLQDMKYELRKQLNIIRQEEEEIDENDIVFVISI